MPEEPKDSEIKKKLEKNLRELESGASREPKKTTSKTESSSSSRTWLQEKPKSKHQRLLVAVAATAGVMAVGITSWLAYALWYQNPDKVVMDAMVNAMTAKTVKFSGASSTDIDQTSFSAVFDGQWGHKEGGSGNVKLAYKTEKGDEVKFDASAVMAPNSVNYLKLNNVQELYDLAVESMGLRSREQKSPASQMQMNNVIQMLLRPIVQKVEGKWIKFSVDDVKKVSATQAEQYECVTSVLDKIESDKGLLADLGQAYAKDRFIDVQRSIGSKDGSLGFAVGLDKDALQRFSTSLKKTTLYKEFQKCSPIGTNPLAIDVSQFPETSLSSTFEVWVDQWSHQLTKIKFEDSRLEATKRVTDKFELETTFNTSISVNVPSKDIVTFDEALSGVDAFVAKTMADTLNQRR